MKRTLFLSITRAMEFQNPKLKIFDIAGFYAPAKVLKVGVFITDSGSLVEFGILKVDFNNNLLRFLSRF